MGLISLTWVFCHNLVKIHLVVIEILSFSCSVLLLVKADGNHLAVPICKKNQNGLMQDYCNTKLVQSIERFFQFLYFAIFSKGCHLERSILI